MSWLDLLDGAQFLKTLFPNGDPPLELIRLHEVQLRQNGPVVLMRFDLNDYPAQPPEKWRAAMSNVVQVRLLGIGVRRLQLDGWASDNVGRLLVEHRAPCTEVEFVAPSCRIMATFEHLRLDGLSAYRTEAPDSG